MLWLIDYLFGRCRHRKISRVFFDKRTGKQYVVCLDYCHQRLEYSWENMKLGPVIEPGPTKDWRIDAPTTEHTDGVAPSARSAQAG